MRCTHEGCRCQAVEGNQYCSDYCSGHETHSAEELTRASVAIPSVTRPGCDRGPLRRDDRATSVRPVDAPTRLVEGRGPTMTEKHEPEGARLDRKLIEMLNEIRVGLPGVQVLMAFLLIAPPQRWVVQDHQHPTRCLRRRSVGRCLGVDPLDRPIELSPPPVQAIALRRPREQEAGADRVRASDDRGLLLPIDFDHGVGLAQLGLCPGVDQRLDRDRCARSRHRLVLVRIAAWQALPRSRAQTIGGSRQPADGWASSILLGAPGSVSPSPLLRACSFQNPGCGSDARERSSWIGGRPSLINSEATTAECAGNIALRSSIAGGAVA